jgi:hypothetical protein
MNTYIEFKEFFGKILLGNRDMADDSDITFELRARYSSASNGEANQVIIKDEELLNIYTKVATMKSEGVELYSEDYYETAVDFDYVMMRNREVSSTVKDDVNGIRYELNFPSLEYSIFLIMKLGQAYNEGRVRRPLFNRIRRTLDFLRIDDINNINLEFLLGRMIGELTLKIKTNSPCLVEKFRVLATAFSFEFMYQSDMPLIEQKDIYEIFRLNNLPRNTFDITQIDTPPLREYTGDVVDYYKLALSSNDPYIKYISFYHVMEYFYDEVFKKKLVEDLKNKITHPSFSYKSDDKIYDIALFIKNRLKMNAQDGQGNELESLKFVLGEFISVEELKNRINNFDDTALMYYQNTKVPFCNAAVISWNDAQGILTQIAKRIYHTRNSLVHSKSGKSDERYRPYKNEPQLQQEIPLVKAVAELIIINSSEIL